MDKNVKNTLIGVIGTILVAFIGAWVQLNSRIAVLEVQVRYDRDSYAANKDDLRELIGKVNDIQDKVTKLGYVKQNRLNGNDMTKELKEMYSIS